MSDIREVAKTSAKGYKQSWVDLGLVLSGILQDKTFIKWGFEKLENYTEKELGLKKTTASKIAKTYQFVLDWEPQLLEPEFLKNCTAETYPDFDAMQFLSKVRSNRHLTKDDYEDIKKKVLSGKESLGEVRKELTAMIKERKEVDTVTAREVRHKKASKKFLESLHAFKTEAETLKILPAKVLQKAEELFQELSVELH
jgi:hypothetical protein